MKNIFQIIYEKAKNKKKNLLINSSFSYGDFYNLVERNYNFLRKKVKPKTIICLKMNYSKDFLSIIFSARLNKNIICIINPSSNALEQEFILKRSKPSLLITDEYLPNKEKLSNKMYFKKFKSNFILEENDAFLIFTSGTTNDPKGAIITDNSLKNNVMGIIKQLKLKKNDKTIIFSPPNYAMAISQIVTFLFLQSSIILDNNIIKFPTIFLRKVKKYNLTVLNLNVATFKILKKFKKKYTINSLRLVMGGGMKMTRLDAEEIFNFFENKIICNFYGCTENSPRVSHFLASRRDLKKFNISDTLPVGKTIHGTKVLIKKTSNKKIGEIIITGNSLMRCYLGNLKDKKNIFKYNTQDLGFLDEKKRLYMVGRKGNLFKTGNEKVSPEEVEDTIRPFIKNHNYIIGRMSNDILNWVPILVIENIKKNQIKNLFIKLSRKMQNFKMPKKIFTIKRLPRNVYGKIDRNKINKLANENKLLELI
jgi:long-chain acyl-CoA synthetase